MEHQVLIVVLDGELPTDVVTQRMEDIWKMGGVLAVRTIERVVADATGETKPPVHGRLDR